MPPFGSVPYAGDDSRITDILLRLGDIQARKAEQQGDIWGGAVAGLGQQAGDLIQQHAERKSLAARDQALVELMGRPDATPQDFAKVAGPTLGLETYAAVQAFNKTKTGVSPEEAAKLLPVQLKVFKKLTPEARAQLYPALRENTVKAGLIKEQDAPASYTADLDPMIDSIISAYEPDQKLEKVTTKGPRGEDITKFVAPTEGLTISGAPPIPEPPKPGSFEAALVGAYGPNPTPEQTLAFKGRWESAGRAPAAAKEGPKLGSLENYLAGKYGEHPTPAQVLEGKAEFEKAGKATEGGENGPKALSGEAANRLAYSSTAIKLGDELKDVFSDSLMGHLRYQGAYTGLDTGLKRKIEDFLDTSVRARSGATTNPTELKERRGQIYQVLDFLQGGNPNAARASIVRIVNEMKAMQEGLDPTGEHRKRIANASDILPSDPSKW